MNDSLYMQRALELAANGIGHVAPNPMVGCVIVHQGRIIGEGWHRNYGGPHAEVNAVNSVVKPELLKEATVYVTLEPCSHFGKTPPCADLLIRHQVRRVIISNSDPNPQVNGKGIKKLQDAGIEVETGLLAEEGERLNRRFFTFINKNRPYIILKWAETADGFIARADGKPLQISNQYSQMYAHKWRSEEAAILVGSQTVINDDPQLSVRNWQGRNPVRVVLDPHEKAKNTSNIFDNTAPTLYYNLNTTSCAGQTEKIRIPVASDLNFILQDLYKRNIQSLIVEGGCRLHQLFIDQNLYDEIRVFKNTKKSESGIAAANIPAGIGIFEKKQLFDDELRIFLN